MCSLFCLKVRGLLSGGVDSQYFFATAYEVTSPLASSHLAGFSLPLLSELQPLRPWTSPLIRSCLLPPQALCTCRSCCLKYSRQPSSAGLVLFFQVASLVTSPGKAAVPVSRNELSPLLFALMAIYLCFPALTPAVVSTRVSG